MTKTKNKKSVLGDGKVLKPIRVFFGPSRVQSKKPFGNQFRVSRSKFELKKWRLKRKWPNSVEIFILSGIHTFNVNALLDWTEAHHFKSRLISTSFVIDQGCNENPRACMNQKWANRPCLHVIITPIRNKWVKNGENCYWNYKWLQWCGS